MPHNAARELDLVAKPSLTHPTSRFTQVSSDFRPFACEIATQPFDVVLQLLNLTSHFCLELVQALFALRARRAGVGQVLHVAGNLTLLIRQVLRATRGVFDSSGLP